MATFFAFNSMHAQPKPTDNQTVNHFRRAITIEEKLDYLLFLPKDYDPGRVKGWPMILFLHGAGERGSDLSLVKTHGPPKLVAKDPEFPFIVVSPQCPKGRIWRNSELIGLLDEVVAAHNVDTGRVYLTGLSMGGYGTWSLGLAEPDRFAAIAPICGGGERISILLAEGAHQEALLKLPIWVFHGATDPVVPLDESERTIGALNRLGKKDVKLTVYPEVDHDSWTKTYNNPELFQWFLQQQRKR